jgi:ABC-2 type transport system ATP-binding protein
MYMDSSAMSARPAMVDAQAPALELKGVNFSYGEHKVLDGMDLVIPRGAFVSLLGPNGAGKTTALRIAAGLAEPAAGEVRVCGHSRRSDGQQARTRMSYVPDEPTLYPVLSALEFLEFVGALREMDADETRSRSLALLERVGLASVSGQRIGTYSRGMRQKLALAGALLHQPELLVLDEPFTGLDPISAKQVRDVLLALVSDGMSVLLSTHQLQMAERLSDRIMVLARGRIVAEGTAGELRAKYGSGSVDGLEEAFVAVVDETSRQ